MVVSEYFLYAACTDIQAIRSSRQGHRPLYHLGVTRSEAYCAILGFYPTKSTVLEHTKKAVNNKGDGFLIDQN
jgi:hypothetical protein